jgi:hypothetical protein
MSKDNFNNPLILDYVPMLSEKITTTGRDYVKIADEYIKNALKGNQIVTATQINKNTDAIYDFERQLNEELYESMNKEIIRKMYQLAAENEERKIQYKVKGWWSGGKQIFNEIDPYGEENWEE